MKFSHINDQGKQKMVDVSKKPNQKRVATATGRIYLQETTIMMIKENRVKKGDVLAVAKTAGIMMAKKTSDIIPLCHPLMIDFIDLNFFICSDFIECRSMASFTGKTGVEMEALSAVSASLLTIYDMCKSLDKKMVITEISLIEKKKL